MIDRKNLELLQFDKIKAFIEQKCSSERARALCRNIHPSNNQDEILRALRQTAELKAVVSNSGYFPSLEHEDVSNEHSLLGLEGSMLSEGQLMRVLKTTETSNSLIRFVKGRKADLPLLAVDAADLVTSDFVAEEINRVLDAEGQVRNQASPELARIRKSVAEKRRESDKKFYNYVNDLRRHGYLRENEESFFSGRRTLAVLVEYKGEVPGFVHGKSESGKTIFIEPGVTININNDVAELEVDEHREINRILRALCANIRPHAQALRNALEFLVAVDFLKARTLFATSIKAILPEIVPGFEVRVADAYHPLLLLQNQVSGKKTVPLSLTLYATRRILLISGPNAGGKTIALKTVGLLQVMLQSGLLIPVSERSKFSFFEKVLIDIGDTQSIENELSTYSAKLKSMTTILNEANEGTLVLMDEFGSGTDPELGGAIAEAVLENLVNSQTRGIITSHFGNVKLLAEKLEGALNASMLFDTATLEPRYVLSEGEPGSSYTFEVAERIGFPKHLIERAKQKVDKDKLRLNKLLVEVQEQKNKLESEVERTEHETFMRKIAKEKYNAMIKTLEDKKESEREKRIEQARLAEYGQKYLKLMDDWQEKKDRKVVIKRFIDGITAETKKKEALKKQQKLDAYSEKRIARLKPKLKVGSKVKILNSREAGIIEQIKDEKVIINFGLMKMTVGMENLVLAED